MGTVSESLGENCPCELLGNVSLGVLPGEGEKGLGEGVEGNGEKAIFEISYHEVGCSRGYGGQKGVRVRDCWECHCDGLIDFLQILDQSARAWSLL